jgi:RNA polymerase sigma-70 factor (ECF subfamily)
MTSPPETRPSLLIRLKDQGDQAAWTEFVNVYRPVIYRLATKRGMQHADAEDLAQQVLASLARAIERWEDDPQRARFRTWLRRVANNAIVNALTRGKPDRASGDSEVEALLHEHPARNCADSALVRLEVRREILCRAAKQVRKEFQSATWCAFWLTSVEGGAVEDAASKLGKSLGSVYAARSRVMRRLKEKIEEFEYDSTNE